MFVMSDTDNPFLLITWNSSCSMCTLLFTLFFFASLRILRRAMDATHFTSWFFAQFLIVHSGHKQVLARPTIEMTR